GVRRERGGWAEELGDAEQRPARRESDLMDRETALRRPRVDEPAPPDRPDAEPEPEPVAVVQEPDAEPEPEPAAAGADARWNLEELAALVEARGADFPDRIDEWRVRPRVPPRCVGPAHTRR